MIDSKTPLAAALELILDRSRDFETDYANVSFRLAQAHKEIEDLRREKKLLQREKATREMMISVLM